MKFITQQLILRFGAHSSIYHEFNAIRNEILCAFDIDLSNGSAKKLLQQQWGTQ
jgi:hypothetical protein